MIKYIMSFVVCGTWIGLLPTLATVMPVFQNEARGQSAARGLHTYDDHQNMMDQLGIRTLRPGKSGSNQTGKGFDEATANDWMPTLPDVLTMKDGTKVTAARQWPARRAEIVEDFEREVYGRIPDKVPKVTWEATNTTVGNSGGIATVSKTLVGHVDNGGYPRITVNIQASFTVPANATGPVPILIQFGGGGFGTENGDRRRILQAPNLATQTLSAALTQHSVLSTLVHPAERARNRPRRKSAHEL